MNSEASYFGTLLARARGGEVGAWQRLVQRDLSASQLTRVSAALAPHMADVRRECAMAPFRLGIVSSHSTNFIANVLPAVALRHNVGLDCVEARFGAVLQEVLDPNSSLKGQVDAVLVAMDPAALSLSQPALDDASAGLRVQDALQILREIQAAIRGNIGATCLFASTPSPAQLLFGSYDRAFPGAPATMIREVNAQLSELIEPGDAVVDIAATANLVGLARWHDARMWFHGKLPCAIECCADYAGAVCAVVAAITGRSRKCLVLDLDNTIWGGTIGDDGLGGIVLGPGSALGEAYLTIQAYALDLRSRGILLAVCSKNELANALEPFERHPEMLLKRGHVAAFVADWSDKAANLRVIAASLRIGTDALVFVDDNPAERDLIRRHLPEVAVPEIGDDPADYPAIIASGGWFDAIAFSREDIGRADAYAADLARAPTGGKLTDLDDYLASLQMIATIQPFDAVGRARIAQLIAKSNQFNLTTKRYDEAQVAAITDDPAKFALQVRLADRFGDSGMVCVVIFDKAGSVWSCDTWLMSCRVLGRRLEEAVLAEVVVAAARAGAETLQGSYVPSGRNGLVADLFGRLGFTKVAELPDGTSEWEIDAGIVRAAGCADRDPAAGMMVKSYRDGRVGVSPTRNVATSCRNAAR